MKLDAFIKRPIFSASISVLIVLLGILSALSLPIERYPSIAPPSVEVTTKYYGANAETLVKTVVTPLEEAINGVQNMLYMYSVASNNGEVTTTVVFKQGTNPDIDAVNVQNRIQKAMSQLPSEVKTYGVTVEKIENSILQIFSVYSPDDTYDYEFLSNFLSINIKPRLLQISGVGKLNTIGCDYSMRVWLDPSALVQHNLTPSEVVALLQSQNIEAGAGALGENSSESYQYAMRYTGRLKSVKEFEDIVLRYEKDGSLLRLGQVARIELGAENYAFYGETNGHPGVMAMAYQSTGSNATEVNNKITALLEEVKANAPSGIDIVPLMNTNDFLYASIDQVLETLRDAIILVILIVLVFLGDLRSTLIPFISIMVSLIGTFAFMAVAGFSINLLTLFALVLVIGTVVDDSIVVVEAVNAKFLEGETSPYKATKHAVSEVTMAVLTSSLVFMAVFIPVSMLGGTSGEFYKQFGLTMAVAVGISALNALTLVPALCAMILRAPKPYVEGEKKTLKQRYAELFDKYFGKFINSYKNGLGKVMPRKVIIWIVCAGAFVILAYFMETMPSGLVPQEDQGSLIVEISSPPGTSLTSTKEIARQIAADLVNVPGVETVCASSGYGFVAGADASAACVIMKLKHWSQRSGESSFAGVYANVEKVFANYPSVNGLAFQLPMIPGYGNSNGVDLYVQDRRGGTTEELFQVTQDFLKDLANQGVYGYMAFNMNFPQWELSVDVPKAMKAGLTPQDVMNAVGVIYGGSYVSDINLYSKVYKVMVQGDPEYRRDEDSFSSSYIRTASGEMAPLSSFVKLKRVFGAESIKTFNKYLAINVNVAAPNGMGKIISAVNQAAKEYLPEGYTVDYAGMAREQNSQGSLALVLILCSFVIYLILASLYESAVIPLAVLLTVPIGLAASYGFSSLAGLDNNIYLQTGVIMLIGLLSKTGILITEFAVDRHKHGMGIDEAALSAAGARLRPIMMTAGTMVIGLLPLITSKGGVGGMGNFSLGVGTICGMIIGTVGLLFITPIIYTTTQRIQDKMKTTDYEKEDKEDEQQQ